MKTRVNASSDFAPTWLWRTPPASSLPPVTTDESNLYGGRDPRDIPAYSVPAAAQLAGIPATTLRSWVLGRSCSTKTGVCRAAGLIKLPAANKGGFLSFTNLVEVHVLAAMRREHELKLETVRNAIRYLKRESAQDRPLAYEKFRTNGVDLFVERYGDLVNASRDGQVAIRSAIEASLQRVEYEQGRAVRLFPVRHRRAQVDHHPPSARVRATVDCRDWHPPRDHRRPIPRWGHHRPSRAGLWSGVRAD